MVLEFLSYTCSSRDSSILKFRVQSISNDSFLETHYCATLTAQLQCGSREQTNVVICATVIFTYCCCWPQKLLSTYSHKIHHLRLWLLLWSTYIRLSLCPKYLAISVFPTASWESISDTSDACITRLDEIEKV